MTLLADKAVLLAKVETTFRTDASPSASTDALLIGNPEYNLDVTQLSRDIVREDFSPLATSAGRKVASLTFTHEVRNNGNTTGTSAPRVGVLLRGCGFAQTQITGASGTIGNASADAGNTGTVSFAKTTAFAGIVPRTVTIECTQAGGTGTAQVSITAPAVGEVPAYSATGVTLTNATPVNLPNSAQVTPTISASLDVGDIWTIELTPSGYEYTPISSAFESLTLYLYRDGLLHKLTGARGNVSMQATGGQYAQFTFTFTGDYVAITDAALPSATYETQKPVQVELANLTIDDFDDFAAAEFTFDQQNDVQIREDVNSENAYAGALIVGRAPTIGFNPEAVLEATHPVWARLAAGTEMAFRAKIGTTKGNVVRFVSPNVQYTNVQYGDRNSILTYDITLNCARVSGNDEVKIAFN